MISNEAGVNVSQTELLKPTAIECLVFFLDGMMFGIDVLQVQEVRACDSVKKVEGAGGAVKGLINVQGNIVPVLDLRAQFNMDQEAYDEYTAVIAINLNGRTMGVVVDCVSDVVDVHIEQGVSESITGGIDKQYVSGVATIDDNKCMLIDVAEMMSLPEILRLEAKVH